MPGELVGPGSGISPLMGSLEARAEASWQGKVLAPCLFYFVCRDSSEILHADRLQTWLEDGVLTEPHVAKTRESLKADVCAEPDLPAARQRVGTPSQPGLPRLRMRRFGDGRNGQGRGTAPWMGSRFQSSSQP
ncbi:unnamed protein product [Ectocarpus sp. 12 AP-2014]